MNPQEPPVTVGDVVMVQLTESAFEGFGGGGVAEPGVEASIVVLAPGVPSYGSTQVRIHGISYEVSSAMMDAFGYGVPVGLPV
jgi:predicted RNA-binding protein with TRAM domain